MINAITARLSKILYTHFGVKLEPLTVVQGLDIDPDLIITFDSAREGEIKAVRFTDQPKMNVAEFEMTKDLVRSFLEGILAGDHELDDLETVSSHLESLAINDKIDQSEDVVRLDTFRKNPYPFVWGEKADADDGDEYDDVESEPRAQLILGGADAVYRNAFDSHSASGRFAFVKMSDLNPDVWSDAVAIRRLGNLTVFVEDITALTFDEQDKMLEMLEMPPSDEQPYFIYGANTTLPELRRSHKVRENFLAYLRPTQLGSSSQTGHFLSP